MYETAVLSPRAPTTVLPRRFGRGSGRLPWPWLLSSLLACSTEAIVEPGPDAAVNDDGSLDAVVPSDATARDVPNPRDASGGGDASGPEADVFYGHTSLGYEEAASDCSAVVTDPSLIDGAAGNRICVVGGNEDQSITISRDNITVRGIGDAKLRSAILAGNGVVFEGFHFTQGARASIEVTGDNATVRNNDIDIVSGDGTWGLFQDSRATNTHFDHNTVTGLIGWGVETRGDQALVEHNHIHAISGNGDGDGIKFHAANSAYRYNYIHDIWGRDGNNDQDGDGHHDCFQTHEKSGAANASFVIIENNYCIRATHQCLMMEGAVNHDILIRNNVCVNFDNQSINIKADSGMENVWVLNNYTAATGTRTSGDGAAVRVGSHTVHVENHVARTQTLFSTYAPATDRNNIAVTAAPIFDLARQTSTPFPDDLAAARGFAGAHGLRDSGASPELPSWLDAHPFGGVRTDIDGRPREDGVIDRGPWEL